MPTGTPSLCAWLDLDRDMPRKLRSDPIEIVPDVNMPTKPGLVYWLGNSLYIALTNRPRGLALAASRGPAFKMPATSGFEPLADEPTAAEVIAAVRAAYDSDPRKENKVLKRLDGGEIDPGVVFAGLGDPLLRLETLREAAEGIRDAAPSVALRVSTTGLVAPAELSGTIAALQAAEIDEVTVALNAASPDAYAAQMLQAPAYQPPYFASAPDAVGEPAGLGFGDVCGFIAALAENGIPTIATCVAHPDVDVAAVRKLATALGAGFKERSWHP